MAEQTELDRQTPMTLPTPGWALWDQLRALENPRSPQPSSPTTHSTSREEDTATLILGELQLLEVPHPRAPSACWGLQLLQGTAQPLPCSCRVAEPSQKCIMEAQNHQV